MSELLRTGQECCDECDNVSGCMAASRGRLWMRPSCDKASRAGRGPKKSRSRERPNCAAPTLSEACCDTRLDEQTFPIEHNQKNVADRGWLDVSGEQASNSTATATVGDDERDGGRAGKCGVKRRVRADKALTSLRTRQWLGVRLASLSVPPVAPSLTPRPSQLAHKGLAFYPKPATASTLD
mgnify:CR=1 FL=1